jgi:hypothetical protein
MIKSKMISSMELKDYIYDGSPVKIYMYGLFDTEKILWTYYVTLIYKSSMSGNNRILGDLVSSSNETGDDSIGSLRRLSKFFKESTDGETFMNTFKTKWESGSNNTTQEMRDKKLEEILK